MKIEDLKQFCNKVVILRMTNGEVVKARINSVDDEDEDVIAAVVESSNPENYRGPCAVYTFAAADIVSAESAQ